ncbi:MAG: DUF4097 family beta strand repeat-containing protein, partial [Niameybacter sp.]
MLRKSTIVALAGCLIVGGIGLSTAGLVLGGKTSIGFDGSGIRINGITNNIGEGASATSASEALQAFSKIDIDVDTIAIDIVVGNAYSIDVAVDSDVKISYGVENDRLFITQSVPNSFFNFNVDFFNDGTEGNIIVTIPGDVKLESTEIDFGVGTGNIKGIKTEELKMTIGVATTKIEDVVADEATISGGVGLLKIDGLTSDYAEIYGDVGAVEIKNLVTNKAKLESGVGIFKANDVVSRGIDVTAGVGSISLQGDVQGDISVEGGVGTVTLDLDGAESDYNFDISRGVGSIKINNEIQHGLEDVKI